VSVTASPGELLAVRGPSGSGKSSLLSLLGGITAPDGGTVTFAGRRVAVTHAAPDVGLMLQGHALAAVLTARENVEISLQARGCPRRRLRLARRPRCNASCSTASATDPSTGSPAVSSSAWPGARDRPRPALLLVDEPTSELDEPRATTSSGELVAEAARGSVVVIATHDPDVVAVCDRV
jgi:putative ABC transport system ATP-binding protein